MGRLGRNRRALDAAVKGWRSTGRLEGVDEPLVIAARSLADAVDAWPAEAPLWRQYRQALTDLREVTRDDGDDLTELLGRLSAEVGDETSA